MLNGGKTSTYFQMLNTVYHDNFFKDNRYKRRKKQTINQGITTKQQKYVLYKKYRH